jgi:hypothetical protein
VYIDSSPAIDESSQTADTVDLPPARSPPAVGRVQTGREVVKLIEYLEYWSNGFPQCLLYRLIEDDSDYRHPIKECPCTG